MMCRSPQNLTPQTRPPWAGQGEGASADHSLVVEADVVVASHGPQLHVGRVSEHLPEAPHIVRPGTDAVRATQVLCGPSDGSQGCFLTVEAQLEFQLSYFKS